MSARGRNAKQTLEWDLMEVKIDRLLNEERDQKKQVVSTMRAGLDRRWMFLQSRRHRGCLFLTPRPPPRGRTRQSRNLGEITMVCRLVINFRPYLLDADRVHACVQSQRPAWRPRDGRQHPSEDNRLLTTCHGQYQHQTMPLTTSNGALASLRGGLVDLEMEEKYSVDLQRVGATETTTKTP